MRLAITVDPLCSQIGGIGRYTLELCKGLQHRSEIGELLFYRNGRWIDDPYALLRDEEVLSPRSRYLPQLWHAWRERRRYAEVRFHGTNFFLPSKVKVGVITVHDLSVLRFPELHPAARIAAFERMFMGSLERAVHIITPSETIRREVIEMFKFNARDVTAIPLAAGAEYRPRLPEDIRSALSPWGLEPDGYGLSVATIEPRKKLEQSLAAWERLPPALRQRYPLVIVGGAGWENDSIRARIRRGEDQGWLRSIGYFPEEALPSLYAGARLLLYPSTYEGFGLPVVEGMASGTPCIISSQSCLVEVTEGVGMQVDPDDVIAFSSDIERGLTDETWRAEAKSGGLRIASNYSWDRCISGTVDVYERAFAGSD